MDFKDYKSGTYRDAYEYKYFMPEKINHSFICSNSIINEILEKASFKLGELNSFSRFVPDIDMFIIMHIFKEAVLSSEIEGTQTNISEALHKENEVSPDKRNDWLEVNNYVEAMNTALKKLDKLPLSNRLIKETHKILLSSGRGKNKTLGEFRKSQNWIGGASLLDAIYIPPSHVELPELLSDFEKFLNNTDIKLPHLIKIAVAHYQFETIHPFLDGNGRIGRLLITLYLVSTGVLTKPLLYLSDFFNKNKNLYYDNLTLVREKNDMIQWIKFFLVGVLETSENAIDTLNKIVNLKNGIEKEQIVNMGKRHQNGLKLLNTLFKQPVVHIKDVEEILNISNTAATNIVNIFVDNKILYETTGSKRNRSYLFRDYIDLFD